MLFLNTAPTNKLFYVLHCYCAEKYVIIIYINVMEVKRCRTE